MRASGGEDGTGRELPEALWRLEQALQVRAAEGDVAVPPYPAVALRVQEVMGRKHFSLGEVAELIGADAVLASDILRCANSVMYRRGAPVIDLTQALTRIGVQQVMRLLLASGLATHAQALGPLVPLRRMVWIEGLAGAAVCQELARLRGLRTEDAFTLGLLHDFGKVVALAGLEALLEQEKVEGAYERDAWEAVVERLHQPLGLAMAARWKLPKLVGEVVAAHHGGGPCSDPRLLKVVEDSDGVVALLLRKARVTEQDLAGVPGLAAAERAPVALVLEQIPDFVAAFETPAGAAAVASPRIAPPPPGPPAGAAAGRRPVRFGVSVSVARRPRMFSATAIGEEGLLAVGDEPLPEHRLLEAKIYGPQPFSVWVLSRLCRREGAGWQVELQPFALSGAVKELWSGLVAGEPPRA
ncbi:MAG: HDOD domain-containing protein [Anaeromyxobacteraceae bacterium]|nr:HDOD domain-containing protein [Anaeromyxobacteraceae bacterium]